MLDKEEYIIIYKQHLINRNLKETTIYNDTLIIGCLIDHFNSHYKQLNDLTEVNKNMVYVYITVSDFSDSYKSNMKFIFRGFFDYMYKINRCSFDGRSLFPVIRTNKRDNLISFYTPEEISEMLSDFRDSPHCGNRNKCMTLIAAKTGLRASDIVWLKFSEISWDKQIINKIQKKTSLPVMVSFDDDIKFSLIDYIKNYRPKVKSDFIFLNYLTGMPLASASPLTMTVGYHFKKSKVEIGNRKFGPHALRFSLAASLIRDNTPLPVITGILGHNNLDTTKRYLSIDVENLRHVALEVPEYE